MTNSPVLVLNQSFEPLNICMARRAIILVLEGKAEMLENGLGCFHSASKAYPIPSVIKLEHMVRRPHIERRLTRIGVFYRDGFVCQYCGRDTTLTIDHVIPRRQGGRHTWENVVAACVPCNRHKAGRTPEQANMRLRTLPAKPRETSTFLVPHRYTGSISRWQKYLPNYVPN
ncbi:MAG: HNH endonuclease [Dehalococcoidia bacterium]|nr:HNH endonuclease [Dehalococcoidia bacterium]